MTDLDRLIPALALIGWLLYLVAGYPRFRLSRWARRSLQVAALLTVGIGIVIGVVATLHWMTGTP